MRRPPPARTERGGSRAPALVLLALAALPACAVRRAPAPPLSPAPEALAARRPPARPFRAAISGRIQLGGRHGRFTAGFGARPPDLRLDLFHPVGGGTVLSLGTSGGRLRAVWPGSGECLEADATADMMRLLVGFRIEPRELVDIMLGRLPGDDALPAAGIRFTPLAVAPGETPPPAGRDRLRIESTDRATGAQISAELLAAREGAALRGERLDADGTELLIDYPRWNGLDSPGHPARVILRVPQRDLKLQLNVQEWSGEGPEPGALLPSIPPGCRMLTAGELAAMGPAWQVGEPRP
jgi:hypothetical protein